MTPFLDIVTDEKMSPLFALSCRLGKQPMANQSGVLTVLLHKKKTKNSIAYPIFYFVYNIDAQVGEKRIYQPSSTAIEDYNLLTPMNNRLKICHYKRRLAVSGWDD